MATNPHLLGPGSNRHINVTTGRLLGECIFRFIKSVGSRRGAALVVVVVVVSTTSTAARMSPQVALVALGSRLIATHAMVTACERKLSLTALAGFLLRHLRQSPGALTLDRL